MILREYQTREELIDMNNKVVFRAQRHYSRIIREPRLGHCERQLVIELTVLNTEPALSSMQIIQCLNKGPKSS